MLEGQLVVFVELGVNGKFVNYDIMEVQMRCIYENVQVLLVELGGLLVDVVEEMLFVIDVLVVFVVSGKVWLVVYGQLVLQVVSNLIGVLVLVFLEQFIEIVFWVEVQS